MENFIESIGVELECGTTREAVDQTIDYASKHRCLHKLDVGSDGTANVSGVKFSGMEVRMWDTASTILKTLME